MRHRRPGHLTRTLATAGLLALGTSLLVAAPAAAAPAAAGPPAEATCVPADAAAATFGAEFVSCIEGVNPARHLEAFAAIAAENGGNRASTTPGYDASVAYVVEQAEAAGLQVETAEFEFPYFEVTTEAFAQTAPAAVDYATGTDFATMSFSASTDGPLTATAVPVDLGGGSSGCEATDFAGFPAGAVALTERGTCPFGLKAQNALAAGAAAVVVANNVPGVLNGTLGEPLGIPAVGVTPEVGAALANAQVSLELTTVNETRTDTNVIAETTRATGPGVVVVGAHLDSVAEGAGINDNGTGSAGVLTAAQLLADVPTTQTIRFAWWGAEELGLQGSTAYVAGLSPEQVAEISGYLNFDMIGSPNYARFVYDGDGSTFGVPGPEGSAQIETLFESFYDGLGLPYEDTEFSGRSDYGPFIAVGIPAGGLFTGAEGIKTPEQAAAYGGTAGEAYDACYHAECDGLDNVDHEALFQNTAAATYAAWSLAR